MQENKTSDTQKKKAITTYQEVKIGKTIFRVTSVYLGDIELKRALEDLTVSKALESVSMR